MMCFNNNPFNQSLSSWLWSLSEPVKMFEKLLLLFVMTCANALVTLPICALHWYRSTFILLDTFCSVIYRRLDYVHGPQTMLCRLCIHVFLDIFTICL